MNSTEFFEKLSKAFGLILNDEPDNRDDTINAKLIDSIKSELLDTRDNSLSERVKAYLQEHVLDRNHSELMDKESDVATFFLDLITVCVQANSNELFLNNTLKYVAEFFKEVSRAADFNIESSIFCSILELLLTAYDLLNNCGETATQLTNDSRRIFNTDLLEDYLFSRESVRLFLDAQFKSIFVRKSFKKLLVKHICYLIQQQIVSNETSRSSYEQLCGHLYSLSDAIKLSNLDLEYEIMKFFLFDLKIAEETNRDRLLFILNTFHSHFFKFSEEEPSSEAESTGHHQKYLVYHSNEILLNEHSIESFSYLLAIDNLFSFIDFEGNSDYSDKIMLSSRNAYVNQAGSSVLFYDFVANNLNFVCNCYARNDGGLLANSLNRKKAVDLLFKFLIYFYSFLDQASRESAKDSLCASVLSFLNSKAGSFQSSQFSIEKQVEAAKEKIFHLLTLPLSLRFNNSSNNLALATTSKINFYLNKL
jgi:hypothetical protein